MRVLGIDPGLRITGYGCIAAVGEDVSLIEAGVVRLRVLRAAGGASGGSALAARLLELDADVQTLLARLRPDLVAVEGLFAHYKHPATAIAMGHARGVILLGVRRAGLVLREFKPNEIKKSLTGHGHAEKAQMQRAVQARFALPRPPSPPDVADALAIALCAVGRANAPATGVRTSSRRGRPSLADLRHVADRVSMGAAVR